MMIRKTGLFLVVLVPLLVGVSLYFARNALVAGVATLALQRMLGTPVALEGVDLQPSSMRAGFDKLRIVSRSTPHSYLLVAGPARFEMNGLQLFARKLVVNEMRMDGLGFGVPCPDCPVPPPPPPPLPAPPGAPAADETGGWSLKVPLPELNLDALEEKLDVGRLTGGEKLASLKALDDAEGGAKTRLASLQQRQGQLNAQPRLDTIKKQVDGLDFSSKDPRKLKEALDGVKDASAQAKALRADVQGLRRDLAAEPGRLKTDYARVHGEVNADVAAASRLAHLGGLNVEQVGALVFGPVVLERFNWVLAQFQQVRAMLRSDKQPAAKPRRRSGRLIGYPVTGRAYPGFLLETIAFSGSTLAPTGGEALQFTGQLTGLSSDAAVYGQPMRVEATAKNAQGENWVIRGAFDHRTSPGQDTVRAEGSGVRLGDLKLSGGTLPERVTAQDADVTMQVILNGLALDAALEINANHVQFGFAPGGGTSASARAIRDLFARIDRVRLRAVVGGTLTHPRVGISSSIDQQFSQALKQLLDKRRAEAEGRIRAQIEGQVQAREAELNQRLDAQRAGIDAQMQKIEAQVQAYQDQLARKQAEAEAGAKKQGGSKVEDLKKKLFKR